ncbi:MAG TPA: LLM class flavin-dependent oxidoreductase [Candidatus Solibacter sp.]|jgi:alkanesulfonate monooxygenase SsuD/methylene tetrahydromethanopterin reductase-like flavin-dependent oxidoreductase (luciferase family)|nr:LLM class flavin-dependent oxidoreductase [Candidatus Solibacter sp.]
MELGLGVAAGFDPEVLGSLGAEAEALGYAAIWCNDHPAGEGLLQVSRWATDTRTIELSVGVLALDRHQPEEIAARVSALDLPADRLRLGIGAGLQSHQLEAVRIGVAQLRRVLPEVHIAVAAMGPKMCELAGAIADSVHLNWMTPERVAWALPIVRQGAEAAGRAPVPVSAYIRVAVGSGAAERLAAEADFYAQMPAYARNFANAGVPSGTVGIAVEDPADLPGALAEYAALDLAVVRPLGPREPEAVLAVARAAIG